MQQAVKKMTSLILASALLAPVAMMAQNDSDKKKEKSKTETEQIIITRIGDTDKKIVVEVNGEKILINGKEIDKNDKENNINVVRTKMNDVYHFNNGGNARTRVYSRGGDSNDYSVLFNSDEDRAMLGVTTERTSEGAEVQDVTKESGAEKAGIKEGDIITRIDDKKVEGPDDLSGAIKSKKAGDKISVTLLRDKKEQKITAELTKWKGVSAFSFGPNENFNLDLSELSGIQVAPSIRGNRGIAKSWNWNTSGNPKLGLSVQDTEDGKGVNVLDVDDEGNAAKAGIKEDDVITEVDGKSVNSADDVARIMKESKDKISVKMKLLRGGKTENIDVKIPRKLKTADL
jgi:serine protease Do